MKKEIIVAEQPYGWSNIYFWYMVEDRKEYLFSIPFDREIYQYFRNGLRLEELKEYHAWNRNRMLDHLVEKRIPYEMKQMKKRKGEESDGKVRSERRCKDQGRFGADYQRSGAYKTVRSTG